MTNRELFYFQRLKRHIVSKLKQQFPEIESDISLWKGKEIGMFQVDLEKQVRGRISEKWFYTHLKSQAHKLPRIDILDLLSRYVGFESWMEYKRANRPKTKFGKPTIIGISMLALVAIASFLFVGMPGRKYQIRVVDAYSNMLIDRDKLVITQFFEDQSPREIACEKDGSFELSVDTKHIVFSISAPFYKSDTIRRKVSNFSDEEVIRLYPNDYELIFHYLSNNNKQEWQQRREQLAEMIDDEAVILQLSDDTEYVIEMLDKKQLINKLTLPTKGLQGIDILDIQFGNGKISSLRFIQQKGGNND